MQVMAIEMDKQGNKWRNRAREKPCQSTLSEKDNFPKKR
jgi:hypothetical protein